MCPGAWTSSLVASQDRSWSQTSLLSLRGCQHDGGVGWRGDPTDNRAVCVHPCYAHGRQEHWVLTRLSSITFILSFMINSHMRQVPMSWGVICQAEHLMSETEGPCPHPAYILAASRMITAAGTIRCDAVPRWERRG